MAPSWPRPRQGGSGLYQDQQPAYPVEARPHRPRVLFLTCHLPYPAISGGRLREHQLLTRLAASADIHLVCVSKTYEEDAGNCRELDHVCRIVEVFEATPLDESDVRAAPFQLVRHRSPALTRRVKQIVEYETPDLVHVEGFYMMQHLPETCAVPILLVEQNVEYVLWRQRLATTHDKGTRDQMRDEYLKTLKAEMAAWRQATMLATITPEDRAIIRSAYPEADVRLVPDGADHLATSQTSVRRPPDDRTIAFIGNFAYEPNVDAALTLCRDIYPRILHRVPDARLLLVGNSPPAELYDAAEATGAHVTGRVPDVRPYMEQATVIAAPLRIGGGIKVKVLEALRAGKALVTTPVGVQGLVDARDACLVADDPRRFARYVVSLLRKPTLRRDIEARAERFGATLPTWQDASDALLGCYGDLLAANPLTTPPAAVDEPEPGSLRTFR